MYKHLIWISLLAASCNGPSNTDGKVYRCKVTKVSAHHNISTLNFNNSLDYYTYHTDCGYTVNGTRTYNVGDTVDVMVIDKSHLAHKDSIKLKNN